MIDNLTKWWYLSATLMFVAATFQIANDHVILGAVFFAAATCFTSAALIYQKREKSRRDEKESEAHGNEQ